MEKSFLKGPLPVAAAGAAGLACVALLDYVTGIEVSLSVFYLLPIALLAWGLGMRAGLWMSLCSGVAVFLMDYVLGRHMYSNPLTPYWNALVMLGFFALTAYFISELRLLLRRVQEIAAFKSDMVSMVSHEFNNSLTKISLAATLMEEGEPAPVPEDRARFYRLLNQTAGQMKQQVKNLLNRARLEAGRLRLEKRPLELRRLVREVVDSALPLSDDKGVSILTEFPEKIIPIEADPDAIVLVIDNLVNNAVKYTPSGGRVTIRIAAAGEGLAEFSVADTGVGISKEDLGEIFSGFYRTAQGKAKAKGFGIGLKVSNELLEAHGSRLQVESESGKGSRFFFKLSTAPELPTPAA